MGRHCKTILIWSRRGRRKLEILEEAKEEDTACLHSEGQYCYSSRQDASERIGGYCVFSEASGGLGNGLKQLELSKVSLIAHPMQNSSRNMIGTLVLMCGGLTMSKLRILDGIWKGDFNLVGIPVWREIQITDITSQKFLQGHYVTCSG